MSNRMNYSSDENNTTPRIISGGTSGPDTDDDTRSCRSKQYHRRQQSQSDSEEDSYPASSTKHRGQQFNTSRQNSQNDSDDDNYEAISAEQKRQQYRNEKWDNSSSRSVTHDQSNPRKNRLERKNSVAQPNINVCNDYNRRVCSNRQNCQNLHLCIEFINDNCIEDNCIIGHDITTGHNQKILNKYHLIDVSLQKLKHIVQLNLKGSTLGVTRKLKVCKAYNMNKCTQKDCSYLHICYKFVINRGKCHNKQCKLNHDIFKESCGEILQKAKISINESVRDILDSIAEHLKVTEDSDTKSQHQIYDKHKGLDNNSKYSKYSGGNESSDYATDHPSRGARSAAPKTTAPKSMDNETYSKSKIYNKPNRPDDSSKYNRPLRRNDSYGDASDPQGRGAKSAAPKITAPRNMGSDAHSKPQLYNKPKTSDNSSNYSRPSRGNEFSEDVINPSSRGAKGAGHKSKSIWYTDEIGNVKRKEICYYSVEEKCKAEQEGCSKLHSILHFHWQISQDRLNWLNIPIEMVMELEEAFCKPQNDNVTLPKFDIKGKDKLSNLLGDCTWKLDFKTSPLSTFKLSPDFLGNLSLKGPLHARRLCTHTTLKNTKTYRIPSSTYIWYYSESRNKWVQYGTNICTKNVNPEDIESYYQIYLSCRSKNIFLFDDSLVTYSINFDTMTQTNMKTQITNEVRRRPKFDSKHM